MTALALRGFHDSIGARFRERNGLEEVSDYGDPGAEHRALRHTAALLDLSARGRLVLLGADRRKLLNGQVTNNVRDLPEGRGCYAFLVNAKARVLADLNIYALPGELLLDLEPGTAPEVRGRLEQFVVADDVQVVDAGALYGLLSVQGPHSDRVMEDLGLFAPLPSEPLALATAKDEALGELYLSRHARAGTRGWDLFAPAAALEPLARRLEAAVRAMGGRACGMDALEIARVESGIPRFGVDIDATNLAPEAGVGDRAISTTKGCYSGQEIIARIRTYGQVARALRGLRVTPADPATLPVRGTRLYREGKEVGSVTSCVRSPELGAVIALGYVRRECNLPGTELRLGSPEGAEGGAVVEALPFVVVALA